MSWLLVQDSTEGAEHVSQESTEGTELVTLDSAGGAQLLIAESTEDAERAHEEKAGPRKEPRAKGR